MSTERHPSSVQPGAVFKTLSAFRESAALASAIELELFTAIGAGKDTARDLAAHWGGAERGARILCDYLVVLGFLRKRSDDSARYELTEVSAAFLDRSSARYLGDASSFLNGDFMLKCFAATTDAVLAGGGTVDGAGTVGPDHPVWVDFARGMAPMAAANAEALGELLEARVGQGGPSGGLGALRVLDVAAGHGLYGIDLARRWPHSQLLSLDWDNVLEVAQQNAAAAGVSERVEWIAGDALSVDLPGEVDVALLTAFLHHFDPPTCIAFLERVRASLRPGGWVVAVETIPNEDRVTPPEAAPFAFVMLATTPGGDAYVRSEWSEMFAAAGFSETEFLELREGNDQSVILAR